jgi:alcohol dehydrogenase YqhD (iron-dependent ADH family)
MENFIAYNPTMLHFGKNVTDKLGETVSQYGKTALLIYGKGSVVTNGYYQNIKYHLEKANIKVVEYSGIRPNPVIDDVDKASELCRKENVDLIVALGGGSVIDSAKAVSVCAPENLKVWDVVKGKSKPTKSLPLIAVLTLAATGTEMNPFAVVQNPETSEK